MSVTLRSVEADRTVSVEFVTGTQAPRGDYARARPDCTVDQAYGNYTPADHETYRRLFQRQLAQLPGRACEEFISSVGPLGSPDQIPRFEEVSVRLGKATGWEIVAVPGLIPEEAFFSLLSRRKFPVTDWIRRPEEFDYIVEPDVFHDLFGHVPLLFNPVFADYMQAYGLGGLKAVRLGACPLLARLYWYTVEFGLIQSKHGLRAYGAGILSSAGELQHSVSSPAPSRVAFDLRRIMRTQYRIDTYQPGYFVIDSFDQLFEATEADFEPIYAEVMEEIARVGNVAEGTVLPGEREFGPGTGLSVIGLSDSKSPAQ
jgi:phenylalanine-4-hydroxylase